MKKFILFLFLVGLSTFFGGCIRPTSNTITSIEVVSEITEFDETFDLSDITIKVYMSDNTSTQIPLDSTMLSSQDLTKLNQIGTHIITVSYLTQTTTFTITITGEKGADGREVILQVANGYIQWKYNDATSWNNLIALSELTGASGINGQDGINGKQAVFQINDGFVQWKYETDEQWINLIDLESLNGITPTITIDDGYWVINGIKTTYKATGDDPAPIPVYTVAFNLNGGLMPNNEELIFSNIIQGHAIELPIPLRHGYIFKGWFTGETVNDIKFSSYSPVLKNINLTAKWELDLSLVIEFLKSTNLDSYSINISRTTNNETKNENYKFYKSNNIIHLYESKEVIDLEHSPNEFLHETYRIFEEVNSFNIETEDNKLINLFMTQANFTKKYDLSLLDYNKFSKQENTFKYNYPLTKDLFTNLTMIEIEEDCSFSGAMYLDLDLMTLVIDYSIINPDNEIFEQQIKITYYDIDATLVEVPYNLIYDYISDIIDVVVSTKLEIDVYTDQSIAAFLNHADSIKQTFLNSTDLLFLVNNNLYLINNLFFYILEVDTLKSAIQAYTNSLRVYMEELSLTATEESILDMLSTYDYYANEISVATNVNDVQQLYYDGKADLLDAYIEDVEKIALKNKKNEAINYLTRFEILLEFSDESSIEHELSIIFDDYIFLINSALTIEAVNLLKEDAFNTLLALDLSSINIEYLKDHYITELRNTYLNGLSLSYFSQAIYSEYTQYSSLLEETNHPIYLTVYFFEGKAILNTMITPLARLYGLDKLEEIYDFYKAIIIESELDILEQTYDQYVDMINNTELEEILYIIDEFENLACNFLTIDNFRLYKYNYIKLLENELNEFSNTSTVNSLTQMNNIFNNYIYVIGTCTNQIEVLGEYNLALINLQAAFVLDIGKEALFSLQTNLIDTINRYTEYYLILLEETNFIIHLNANLNIYIQQISTSLTISDAQNLYDEWYIKLLMYDEYISNDQFDNVKDYYISLIYAYVDNLYEYGIIFSIEVIEDYLTEIEISTDIIEAYNSYYLSYTLIFDTYITNYKSIIIDEITIKYNYYYSLIYNEELVLFEEIYRSYMQTINSSNDLITINQVPINFEIECNEFNIDPLKVVKNQNIFSMNKVYDLLKETATTDSVLAMKLIYDSFIINTLFAQTSWEAQQQYNLTYDNLCKNYITQFDRLSLYQYKQNAIYYMSNLTEFSKNLDNPNYNRNVSYLLRTYTSLIIEAPTALDIDMLYYEWNSQYSIINSSLLMDFDYLSERYLLADAALYESYYNYLNYYSDDDDFYSALLIAYTESIYNAIYEGGFYTMHFLYFEALNFFGNALVVKLYEESLLELLNKHEYYTLYAIDSDLALLEDQYFHYSNLLNSITNINEVYIFNDVIEQAYLKLTIDPLKIAISEYLYNLEEMYFNLLSLADPNLHNELTICYSNYYQLISESTSIAEASNYCDEGIIALFNIFFEEEY